MITLIIFGNYSLGKNTDNLVVFLAVSLMTNFATCIAEKKNATIGWLNTVKEAYNRMQTLRTRLSLPHSWAY